MCKACVPAGCREYLPDIHLDHIDVSALPGIQSRFSQLLEARHDQLPEVRQELLLEIAPVFLPMPQQDLQSNVFLFDLLCSLPRLHYIAGDTQESLDPAAAI